MRNHVLKFVCNESIVPVLHFHLMKKERNVSFLTGKSQNIFVKLHLMLNKFSQTQLLNTIEILIAEIFTLRIRWFNEKVGIITNKVRQIQQSTQSKIVVPEEIL